MIQVCSQCGTRWNVRDKQRVWCPRCHGTLLAPSGPAAQSQWGPPPQQPGQRRSGALLPAGYRWVAVRPGAAPPRRGGRRPLGPTPRYPTIPRWGLVEHFAPPEQNQHPVRTGPSVTAVRTVLVTTMAVLAAAAFVHLVRYVLLIINRGMLLNPWLAGAATWGGVLASVLAVFMVVASAVLLTNWLIARRAAAFDHYGQQEPRTRWALALGCLIPVVNLAWAPVFVIELAGVEARLKWLRRPIVVWWLVWIAATLLSGFSIATSFTTDAQGIADNTVTTIVAYLFGLGATLLALQVFLGFERQPVEKPTRRWVMVAAEPAESTSRASRKSRAARAVEPEGEDPAA
ncbi:MAG: DUF4328 domain-containing protein [Actinomycetota bacterium]|nr:DUF4328 domain-containing protein [Actinomycetota bacterium]